MGLLEDWRRHDRMVERHDTPFALEVPEGSRVRLARAFHASTNESLAVRVRCHPVLEPRATPPSSGTRQVTGTATRGDGPLCPFQPTLPGRVTRGSAVDQRQSRSYRRARLPARSFSFARQPPAPSRVHGPDDRRPPTPPHRCRSTAASQSLSTGSVASAGGRSTAVTGSSSRTSATTAYRRSGSMSRAGRGADSRSRSVTHLSSTPPLRGEARWPAPSATDAPPPAQPTGVGGVQIP